MEPLIPRSPHYVGQKAVLEVLHHHFAEVCTSPVCRVVYIEAPGGIGKTFLLQKLPELIGREHNPAIARIIDLSDVDARVGSAIEARIIAGLAVNDPDRQWYRLPDTTIDAIFEPYRQFRQRYERERGQVTQRERDAMAAESRRLFVENLNALSAERPVVLRFDTAEAVVGESPLPELEFIQQEFPTSAGLIAQWMVGDQPATEHGERSLPTHLAGSLAGVLPALQHVLVVICGRPVGERASLYDACAPVTSLDSRRCTLAPLSPTDTAAYLRLEFAQTMADTDAVQHAATLAEEAYRQTDGHPLLLACFAQMHRDPAGLPLSATYIENRAAFEEHLVTTVLNPIAQHTPFARRTLIYCLYILNYARRGLHPAELRACLEQLAYPRPHDTFSAEEREQYEQTLQTLPGVALVKEWPGTDLLYLHDEMHRIIDESRMPDTLGMRDEVLDFLVNLAQQRQRDAEALPVTQIDVATQVLLTTANRIYYELTRRPDAGYERYLATMLQWLNQRECEHALILRDELWRWMNVSASDLTGSPGEKRWPNRERFRAVSRRELRDLAGDDVVWLVKYHLCRDEPDRARRIASLAREHLAAQLKRDDFFRVELDIAEGRALSRLGQEPQHALDLFDDVKALLERDTVLHPFLAPRASYYLGDAYTLSGYVQRTLREYDRATADYVNARKYLAAYQRQPGADIDVTEMRAQASINLAYLDVQQGNFDRAQRLMRQLTSPDELSDLSPYYQALALNVRSIVEMNIGNRDLARTLVTEAWKIAGRIRQQRLLGLVSRQYGVVLHELMKGSRQPDEQASTYFADAELLFSNDAPNLIETLDERSKYERTMAMVFRERGDVGVANEWLAHAEEHINAAERLLASREPNVVQAQMRQGRAFIYRIRDDLATAETLLAEAATILRAARMPRYALIIAGSVAFEYAQIAVRRAAIAAQAVDVDPTQRVVLRRQARLAASYYADALAHCFVFADDSRTRRIFERLINTDFDTMHDEALLTVRDWLRSGAPPLTDTGADLVVNQPTPARWESARSLAIAFLSRVCTAVIETRDHLL